ncbi:hypothetical protein [Gemmatimonas sp. UBA7669]|uniref:hypothetical protein n=1 Tax=Gemmatimonas sp. UBA7669 TaxID=1946568 RepID=UPI0025C68E79|nr:hypothetical protein [Gemmatimonas sp. UBA7669]
MSILIQSCIVCDMVRPELNGKLIVLGFLGVCPFVDIRLPRLDRPTPLTFLLSGHVDQSIEQLSVEVLFAKDNSVIASTGEGHFAIAEASGTINIAPTLLLTFGRSGQFLVRCLADGTECYTGAFTVTQGGVV